MSGTGLARAQGAASGATQPLWGAHADIVGRTAQEHSAAGVEFFVPMLQDQDSLIFIDAGINGDFDSEVYGTFGVGFRQIINPGLILGGIVAVDVTRTDEENTFGAISLGAEAIGTAAEARINVQLPFSGASQISDETVLISQPGTLTLLGNQLVEQAASRRITVDEVPLTGVEGEVGVNLPIGFERFDDQLKAFAGAYHYDGDGVDSFTGVSGRLEYSVRDVLGDSLPGAELILSAGLTHDEEYGTNFAGEARLRIPLGVPAGRDANARALSPIEERMTQRVVRTTRIHTSERTRTETGAPETRVVVDPLTGLPLDSIFFADGAETVGAGTASDPTTLEDAVLRAGLNGTIVAEGNNGTIDTPGVTLANGQRLVGGGVIIPVRLADGTIASFQLGQAVPVISGIPTANVVTLGSGNQVQGLIINGGLSGIAGTNVGALTLQQVTLAGSAGAGFSIVNTTGTNSLFVAGLQVSGTGGPGIAVNGLGGGTTTVTEFSSVGVASAGGGGVLFDGVAFDANPQAAGFQRVEAGNLTIGDQANPAAIVGDGLRLNQVAGDLNFASLLIANSNGAGLFIRDRGGPGGDFSFGNTGGAITTVGGTAIDIDPVSLASRFGSVASTRANGQGSGGTEGLFLDNILARDAGTPALVIDSLLISGAAGDGLVATNNAGNLVFGTTTITDVGGDGIAAENNSGSLTFGATSVTNAAGDGIELTGNAGPITFGATTITRPGGTGILLADNAGRVSFADTAITSPGLDGIDIAGTNGSVGFGNVDITGLGAGIGLDLTDEAGFASTRVALAFQTLDIAGTGAAGSVGIDYSGTTNTFDVTTADSGSISGVAIGIDLRDAAATGLFQFGDGSATDADGRASLITADRPLEIAGLNGTTGLYNLRDVAYVGDISNLTGITVFYVDADGGNDAGIADGSADDPGTLAQAIASGADVIALVDNQAAGQDVIDAGAAIQGAPGSLTLAAGQRVVSFLTEDMVDTGGGSGTPSNLLLTGIDANIVRNPNSGNGAPRLTTTEGGSNTLVLDSNNALLGTVIDNGAGAIAVFGSGISGLTVRDSQIASLSLDAATGNGRIEDTLLGQLAVQGGTIALTGTNVDIVHSGAGAALSVGGGHSGSIGFDAASAITVTGGTGLRFTGTSGAYAFGGPATLGGGANLALLGAAGSLSFGDVTITAPAGNAIDTAGTNGAVSLGNVVIAGVTTGAVGLDFNGAALTGAFTARSLVAAGAGGTPPAGSIGIDLRGVTGGQAIRIGVSPAPNPAADTPSSLNNFATGVFVDAASNAQFTFGDGEDAVDQGSRIRATTRINAASAPTLGNYNFLDVDFESASPGAGFVPATVYYFSETGTGTGATQSDPGSIAGAEASGADVLVPIGPTTINAANGGGGGSLDLAAAQQLRGFNAAGGTLDVGFTGPSTIQISASSSTITDLNNQGSPTLTTSAAQSVVNLSDGNTLSFISITGSTGGAAGIAGIGINNLVANNITIAGTPGAGISLTGTTGNITFTGTTSVTATGGAGVSIAATGGDVSFAALSVDNFTTPTAGGGIAISGPGSFSFTGGLDIRTSAGTGFVASGGATVTVAATGTRQVSTTGPILAWNGVSIGADGASFSSLAATGTIGADAINLTGVSGGVFSGGAVAIAGTGAGFDGIEINGSSASFSFASATIDNTAGNGINLVGANGAVSFATVDIDGAGGAGIRVSGSTSSVDINGGTIGATVATTGPGVLIENSLAGSEITTRFLDVTANGADGYTLTNNAGLVSAIFGSVTQTGAGDGLEVNGGSGGVCFGSDISHSGTGAGDRAVRITGTSGDIQICGSQVTKTNGGLVVEISNVSAGAISFDAAIAANGGAGGIAMANNTGGSTTFNNTVTLATGASGGVALTSNAGHPVTFGGGLAITTTSGTGFTASGGGTITITGSGNTIQTATGPILAWNGVGIGAGGASFDSLTATGSVLGDAISLTNIAGPGSFSGGAVSIAGASGAGADGIAVTGASTAIGFGTTTIGATQGSGILLSGNAGTVTFGGTTTLTNPGAAGVVVTGANGAIAFDSLQIALQTDNTTGVALAGTNLDAGFAATDFDLTSTSAAGTTAIDLSGTTSTGTVRFGDTNVAGQSATIAGAGANATGPTTGIQLANANIANFIFGDGESSNDQGSRITAINRLDASPGPLGGSYNILDVDFLGAAPGPGFVPATAYYFSATGTGTGATIDDPGSIAGAQASGASLLIPVGNAQIDAAGAGGSLDLDANQQLRAFDAPGGTLDVGFTYGGLGVIQTTATAGNINDTAGDGSPELTTTSAAPVVNLSDGNTLSRIRINGGAVGVASTVAINSLTADNLTVSNTTGAGISLAGTTGSIVFGGTTSVTATGGPGVSLSATSGTISFATLSVDNATTAGGGVAISGAGSFNFTNGLAIRTSTGTGFSANSGGTIRVAATAGAETIVTGSGQAISLSGVSVGAGGFNFDEVSANGPNVGIGLINVGSVDGGAINLGTVDLDNMIVGGVRIVNTLGAALNFGSLAVSLAGDTGTAFILNGVALGAAVTADDFDVTNAGARGTTVGIDLTGVTGNQIVRLGDSNPGGASSSIAGVATGVVISNTSSAQFTYGDGESATDRGSTIEATVRIAAPGSVSPGASFNFRDLLLDNGGPGTGFGIGRIIYVDSDGNATGGGDGTGRDGANPTTLAAAEALAVAGDIIVLVDNGQAITAAASGADDTLQLLADQQLLGFANGSVSINFTAPTGIDFGSSSFTLGDPTGNGAATLTSAAGADVVTLGAGGNRVDGFILDGSPDGASRGITSTGSSDTTISNMTVRNFTGPALQLGNLTGTTTLTNVSVSGGAGGAMLLQNALGAVNATNVDLTGSSSLAVTGGNAAFSFDATSSISNTGGLAVSLAGRTGGSFTYAGTVTSDGATAGGISIAGATAADTVSFTGTVDLGGTTALGASGVSINNNGTASVISFADLSVATDGVTAFAALNGGTVNVTTGSLSALGATAISLDGLAAGINLASTSSTGGVNNVALTNVTGTVALGAGALSGATGTAFAITGGNATVSYAGSVTKTLAGQILAIDNSAASVTFSGAFNASGGSGGMLLQNLTGSATFSGTVTLNTGAFDAVAIVNNSGAIAFNGGLVITTTSGTGFAATGTGTVNVAATTGAESVTTSTGRILDWNGVGIGSNGVRFDSLTSSGVVAADAISLVDVGGTSIFSVGSASIAGTSGAGSDGLAIANSAAAFTFGSVTINNTFGNGIDLVGTNGTVTALNTTVNGAAGAGVRVSGTTGFVFLGGSIGGTTVNGGPGMLVENTVSGMVQTSGLSVRANGADAVQLTNNSGAVLFDFPGPITQLGTGDGVDISGGTGSVDINADIVHSGAGGAALRIANTSASITFDGDNITRTGGGVTADISSATGAVQIGAVFATGSVTASGGAGGILIDNSNVAFGMQVSLTTGTANAVTITNNVGRTAAFNRGLSINTTSGAGFTANSGTVRVAASSGTETITTGTGQILGLSNVGIGTGGFNFESLTATGTVGADAISLATVGGPGSFSAGSVSVAATSGAGFDGISIAGSSATVGFGPTTIGATGGNGILLSGNSGPVTFTGQTTIGNPGAAGVDIEGTNGAISFANLDITLGTAGTTGLDLSNAVLAGNITAVDFDVVGTTVNLTLGVNLADTTRTAAEVLRLGDTVISGGQSASIVGTGRGVLFSENTDIDFVFGDGEGVVDTGSLIDVAGRAIDSTGLLLPASGTYNFRDGTFGNSVIENLASISVYFVDQANNGAGAGTLANPGSIDGFEASTANVLVLIDRANNATSDLIDMGTGSLDLADGRVAISFASGDAAIDVSTLGVDGTGAPPSFTFTGIANSPLIQAPGGIDSVRPTLTTAGAGNTINLPTSGTGTITAGVGRVIVRNTGTGAGIAANATAGSVFAILGNDIATTGGQALSLTTTGGTADMLRAFVNNNRFERSTAGSAVSFNGQNISATQNSIALRSFGSNTVTGNGTGGGILFNNVRFDADGAGAAVNATALTVGAPGAPGTRVQGDGVTFLNPIGTFDAGTLNIANNGGTGLVVDTKGAGTTFTLNSTGGAVDTTNGTAMNLDPLTVGMTLGSVTATGGANGIIFDQVAGTFNVTGATSVTGTSGYGITAINTNTGTFTFNTLTVNNGSTAGGGVNVASGTLNFAGNTNLTTAGGTGINQSGGTIASTAGTLALSTGAGTGIATTGGSLTATNVGNTLSSTSGAAAILNGSTANLLFSGTSSGGTPAANISLTNVAGSLDFGNGSLVGSTGTSVLVNGGTAGVSYAGSITSGTGQAVEINGRTGASGAITLSGAITHNVAASRGIYVHDNSGGTITFSGATQSITTTTANAVELATNTGATINFTGGGLDIDTTTGTGFSATGGGTVNVSGAGNTVTATAGRAVLATGVGGTMTFASIASTGSPTDGVNLALSTGASFTVTGNTVISTPVESGVEIAGAGTIAFQGAGSSITGAGAVPFLVTGGTASATWNGSITQALNVAMVSISNHATGTITFNTGTLSATNGTGLQFDNADGVYNFNGTTTLNGGDAGVDILNGSAGSFSFGTGTTITSPTGTAFNVGGGAATVTYSGTITQATASQRMIAIADTTGGSVSFNTTTANGLNNSAATGTGILIDGAAGAVTVANASLTGARGITILGDSTNNATGTFTFTNVAIDTAAGATNHAFVIDGDQGTPGNDDVNATVILNNVDIVNPGGNVANIQGLAGGAVTFDTASTITRNDGGLGILVTSNAGGTITFGGATKTLTTGTNVAVNLTNNTGATVNFTGGGLAISTTAVGFNATGGGTVTVQGGGNTINSGSNTALNIFNTTIGAADLTFQSITSVGGSATGIILDNTGSIGGLHVTGTGTVGSGGTIANKTGADGALTTGNGIYLNNTADVRLAGMQLNDFQNSAIRGFAVNGFSLEDSVISGAVGNNTGAIEGAIAFGDVLASGTAGLTGSSLIDNVNISGSIEHQIEIYNQIGTMNLTISNSSIHDGGVDGLQLEIRGSAQAIVDIDNNQIFNMGSQAIQMSALEQSFLQATIRSNTITRGTQGNEGIVISNGGDADARVLIGGPTLADGNTISGFGGVAIFVGQVAGQGTAASLLEATIQNNTVTSPVTATNHAILAFVSSATGQVSQARFLIDNNNVTYNSGAARAILVDAPDVGRTPNFYATVTNNTVTATDVNAVTMISVAARNGATGSADVRGNVVTYTFGSPPIGLNVREATGGSMVLARGGSGSNDSAAVLAANNPGSTTAVLPSAVDIPVVENNTMLLPAIPTLPSLP
ncbi:right-handed parallel beta-helix repeat-containing protein [Aurantimonas sp. HBX-1]|uniref:right-handed parallel beta-helix repeat-containing protein n=1 Tax=Aurantimonas sp. HBX-1 TaxID=2906072 RepID=UPI001F2A8320|nr:right-handed parallel beta-helix repeat-containing protein [Aurantimonas sp. HBX-1]UIJ71469.1 hypothetical protein LXB15_17445 [Aurantimonas sp. HBX-1]